MKFIITILCAVLLSFSLGTHAGKVYKWVDKDGNVHYSEHPQGKSSQELHIPAAPTPSPEQQQLIEKQREQLLDYSDKQKEQKAKQTQEKKEAEQLAKYCEQARANIKQMEQSSPLITKDKDGKEVYLDEKMRASKIEELKKYIAENCK